MILLSTTLDEYGALLGLTRRSGESLKAFKRRILFAAKKVPTSSLEGLQNHLDATIGNPIPAARFEPNETNSRLIMKGNTLVIQDLGATVLERDNNLTWEDFQDLVAPYFTKTMITQGLSFNMNRVRNIDNLKNLQEVLLGNQTQVLIGQGIYNIVFSDTRYERVVNLEDIDDYLYYIDADNGILFCGSNLYGRISYSYLDDFVISKSTIVIDALNSFDIDNSEPILHPLVTDVYNQYPISNVWR